MNQSLLVADRGNTAVVQEGQPPAELGAWMHEFTVGTVARVIDLSANPVTVATFELESQWVAIP